MQPFQLQVRAVHAKAVHARFMMRDMEMGLNRYRLLPDGTGTWTGKIILPVCVHGRSDWWLVLEVDGVHYQVPFSSDAQPA